MKKFLNIKLHSILIHLNEIFDTLSVTPLYAIASVVLVIVFSSCHLRPAFASTNINPEKLATAIRRSEGNPNYGIKSVPCKSEADCRRVCLNSIHNNLKRYEKTDKSISFFQFMGNRYCPTSGNLNKKEKELNRFWVSNTKRIYETL